MLRSRSRAATLRRSVIRVVAAFTPLGGCELLEDVEVTRNPPACETPQTGCMPVVEECPEAAPTAGGTCRVEGQACTYGDDSSPVQAECRGGVWAVIRPVDPTPNPPYPAFEECPSELPVENMPCAVAETESCEYGDCYGSPVIEARCELGVWRVLESTCNPPFLECGVDLDCEDECPAELPESGSPCALTPDSCSYGDCYGEPTDTARCVEGFWEIATTTCNPPPPDVCPEQPPEPGAECSHMGDSCVYGECLGAPNYYADCVNGRWQFTEYTCNPPFLEEDVL